MLSLLYNIYYMLHTYEIYFIYAEFSGDSQAVEA